MHERPRLSMSGKGGMREMALFLPTDASLSLSGGFTLNIASASSHATQPNAALTRLTLVLFFMMPITFCGCGPAVLFDRPFCPLRQPQRAGRQIDNAVPYDSPFAFFAYPSDCCWLCPLQFLPLEGLRGRILSCLGRIPSFLRRRQGRSMGLWTD